ncbi:MAG: acetate---CoA ligase (ADP-forming) subunit alpha [Thermodesulfobacteriota bacterium]|nr:acetate---CoA ligase (ADP-forming) subunit alpha [Thermodesulfobacteriota bacterium]
MAMGSVQLGSLLAMGFPGPVYPIHPTEKEVLGLPAYARVSDVPGPVGLAVLVIPTKVVPEILEDCGKAGISAAIIVSAGFAEIGSDGRLLQQQIVEIARRYGIRFLGPNCIGAVNPRHKLNTTFYPYESGPGFIGMVSQSGSFVTQVFVHLKRFGLGFSQGLSVGNEAVTDITDCLEYLGNCPSTKVIGLYVEGIRRGREFARIAREVSRKKPIVAYYVGGSSAGKQAGLSHTGAMAGPDELYNGIFAQSGVIRAGSIEELFDFCWVLGSQPLPRGNRIAVFTNSGGPGAAAADAAERSGLRLASFSDDTKRALRDLLPHTASLANPVDMTFARNHQDYFDAMPRILLQDDGVDCVFMYFLMAHKRVIDSVIRAMMGDSADPEEVARQYVSAQAQVVSSLGREYGKPLVGGSFYDRSESFICELQDRGLPILPSPERAVRALGALYKYSVFRLGCSGP